MTTKKPTKKPAAKKVKISEIKRWPLYRISTSVRGFDQVLGGGIVRGSLTVLSGPPGSGKTRLCLQALDAIAAFGVKTLFVSSEQPVKDLAKICKQLELRYVTLKNCVNSDELLDLVDKNGVVVIDTVNGFVSSPKEISELVTALREATCKDVTIIVIAHVNRAGNLAGPRDLAHMADVLVSLDSSRSDPRTRVLDASVKNRFATTDRQFATTQLRLDATGKFL
jgi:DNA repair protein RadA/Sms